MTWDMVSEYCALMILIIILAYEDKGSSIPSFKNRIFRGCLIVTLLSIVSNIISTAMIQNLSIYPIALTRFVTTLYFLFTPIMGLVYFSYIASIVYEGTDKVKRTILRVSVPAIAFALLLLSNAKTKYIFDITPEHGYVRGDYVFLTYLVFYLYCILSVCIVMLNFKKLGNKNRRVLLLFPMLAIGIIVFQQIHPEIVLTGFAASSALLVAYLYIQNRQIYMDYLTKLPNRWELLKMLEHLIEQSKVSPFSLVVLSVKEFKVINDRYGQQVGDAFLQAMSNQLVKSYPTGTVYRFNGDEFAILLPKETHVQQQMDALKQSMDRMWTVGNVSCYLSFALGGVTYSPNYKNADTIIQSIEYAVIEAKKMASNNICVYDETMFLKMERKKQIVEILKTKLTDGKFEMHYQPIYSVQYGNFTYVESLIRMNDTPIGPIYPNEFIPIAEESGIIIELTYVILEKVCRFVKEALAMEIPFQCVHVNFSPLQFSQPDLEERVMEIIREYEIPSDKIKIEFTESAIAESTNVVIAFSQKMKEYGIKMGLDDFGTGYSNMSTVMSIPFHAIKMDKSLVHKAMEDQKASGMIQGMITAFHSLDLQVVAEGVETKEQLDKVLSFGVDQIQGYYFSKPLPKQAALEFLKQENTQKNNKILAAAAR